MEGKTHVSARPINFSVVLGVEIDDVHGAAAVMLDNLVLRVVGATADDPALLTLAIPFL
jgi:hypothetical protein